MTEDTPELPDDEGDDTEDDGISDGWNTHEETGDDKMP